MVVTTEAPKYVVQRKVYTLHFEEYPGMEIKASSVSMGQLLQVSDMADRARAGSGLAEVHGLLELFASRLVSWNLVDDIEQDIPLTLDGMLTLDTDLVLAAVLAWFGAMTQVDESLGKASTNGDTSAVLSLPMEAA